jgi:hypothetical protein
MHVLKWRHQHMKPPFNAPALSNLRKLEACSAEMMWAKGIFTVELSPGALDFWQ